MSERHLSLARAAYSDRCGAVQRWTGTDCVGDGSEHSARMCLEGLAHCLHDPPDPVGTGRGDGPSGQALTGGDARSARRERPSGPEGDKAPPPPRAGRAQSPSRAQAQAQGEAQAGSSTEWALANPMPGPRTWPTWTLPHNPPAVTPHAQKVRFQAVWNPEGPLGRTPVGDASAAPVRDPLFFPHHHQSPAPIMWPSRIGCGEIRQPRRPGPLASPCSSGTKRLCCCQSIRLVCATASEKKSKSPRPNVTRPHHTRRPGTAPSRHRHRHRHRHARRPGVGGGWEAVGTGRMGIRRRAKTAMTLLDWQLKELPESLLDTPTLKRSKAGDHPMFPTPAPARRIPTKSPPRRCRSARKVQSKGERYGQRKLANTTEESPSPPSPPTHARLG